MELTLGLKAAGAGSEMETYKRSYQESERGGV